ncbi:hypothetical protein EES43_02910 [Streptomyces sp. ADI96-02]|nr:hypothetical protein EES43_02910 [Streptomyces sp. ADI96-02]
MYAVFFPPGSACSFSVPSGWYVNVIFEEDSASANHTAALFPVTGSYDMRTCSCRSPGAAFGETHDSVTRPARSARWWATEPSGRATDSTSPRVRSYVVVVVPPPPGSDTSFVRPAASKPYPQPSADCPFSDSLLSVLFPNASKV